jgi:hypothetical protein
MGAADVEAGLPHDVHDLLSQSERIHADQCTPMTKTRA